MAGKVVTVFGGAGFIGRYLVQRLAKAGWMIRVAARRPEQALFLKPQGDVGQIVPIAANIRNELSVRRAVEGVEAVINLVGILSERGRQSFAKVHRDGAERIARNAAELGVARLLHMSALGADANSPSVYARSKAEGESAVRAAFPGATLFRPSIVFGPEDQFFNRFARMARLLPALPLIGGGRTRFQPVYVGDVAAAVLAAAEREDALGKTYELAGPRALTFRELLRYVGEVTGHRRPLVDIPMGLARLQARLGEFLPNPPLTRDQLLMLGRDNVPAPGALGLADLGIQPKALEAVVPTYLTRYRQGGGRRSSTA
jgi:NADH dehydrogenase